MSEEQEVYAHEGHIAAGEGILKQTLWLTWSFGGALLLSGIALVYLGSTGATEINIFSNSFKSQNVGVAGMFCGAVLLIMGTRKALTTLERLGRM